MQSIFVYFLRNASVMYPNHMSDYIYCVYVSKMHRKSFFIRHDHSFDFVFRLKSLMLITPCYLLDACMLTYSPTHDVIL